MSLSVLDTDTISLLQRGDPSVVEQVGSRPPAEVATTIITIEEQLSGWYTLLRRAKTALDLVPIYERMSRTVRFLRRLPILSFTEASAEVYEQLRKDHPRIGRMDLRIAAIAISHNAVLITRNCKHFASIESLTAEDWSR